jgi:flagellar basal-body rod modification protein FlgD
VSARQITASDFSTQIQTPSESNSMTTSSVGSTSGTTSPGTTGTAGTTALNLNTTDFINLMMTQLENQDPLNPTSSDQLMSQMSQIGQLQSTTQLQTTMQTLTTQSQIGAASSLIGKQVSGLDVNSNPISGTVSTVQVASTGVTLSLQQGGQLSLSNVTGIANAPTTSPTGA